MTFDFYWIFETIQMDRVVSVDCERGSVETHVIPKFVP